MSRTPCRHGVTPASLCAICKNDKVSASSSNALLCADCKLKAAIDDFAKRLLENQEPLPPEFQRVIDDNYWELLTDT